MPSSSTRPPDLASELTVLRELQVASPWPGHEHVRGWGVFALPFTTGHVLALRVFPQSDFGPYRTVWHRNPAGDWSIFVDGPRLDTACPRYYGDACKVTRHAKIAVDWTGPTSFTVTVDDPQLHWTVETNETRVLRIMNAVGRRAPRWTWRPRALVKLRELTARRLLDVGEVRLCGTMPSGHVGTLMPRRMYLITESTAVLDGSDLGAPCRLDEVPRIGDVTLPARGVVGVGEAFWTIRQDSANEPP